MRESGVPYVSQVLGSGRRSDELVGQGLNRGEWYVCSGSTVRGLGTSLKCWIAKGCALRVEFGPSGEVLRATRDLSVRDDAVRDVCPVLVVVDAVGEDGAVSLLPARCELRLAQTNLFRAADAEMLAVTQSLPEWRRRSPAHQVAGQCRVPWMRFTVTADTAERKSASGRLYYSPVTAVRPTSERDLDRLEAAYRDGEWHRAYAAAELSHEGRVAYLLSRS